MKMEIHSETLKHIYCKLLDHTKPKLLQEVLQPPQKTPLKPNASSWFWIISGLLFEYWGDKCWQNIFILMRQHLPERSREALANTRQKADSLHSLAAEQPTMLPKDAGKQATQGVCCCLPWIYMSSQKPELEQWVTPSGAPRSWILTADWKGQRR